MSNGTAPPNPTVGATGPAGPPGPQGPPGPTTAPVPWYKSQRFIIMVQSTILLVLGWGGQALATNDWSWRPIAIAVVGNVLLMLKDWWSPTVIAPFAALNRSNVQ